MKTAYIVIYSLMAIGVLLIIFGCFSAANKHDRHHSDDSELPTFIIAHKIGGKKK